MTYALFSEAQNYQILTVLKVIIGGAQIWSYELVNQSMMILKFSEMILYIRDSIVPRYWHPTMCLSK